MRGVGISAALAAAAGLAAAAARSGSAALVSAEAGIERLRASRAAAEVSIRLLRRDPIMGGLQTLLSTLAEHSRPVTAYPNFRALTGKLCSFVVAAARNEMSSADNHNWSRARDA
jgi:hypothetical protein